MKTQKPHLRCLAAFALCLFLSGCDNSDPVADHVASKNKTNIQKVANTYILYSALNRNRGPRSEEELIDFVENFDGIDRNLKMMGIERTGFSDSLVSSVDGQKFTVRWGLDIDPEGAGVPLVFETRGADDMRRVCLSNSRIVEVEDNVKYKKLLAGNIDKEDAGQAAWEGGGQQDGVPEGE